MPRDLNGLPVFLISPIAAASNGTSENPVDAAFFNRVSAEDVECRTVDAMEINAKAIGSSTDRIDTGFYKFMSTANMRLGNAVMNADTIGDMTIRIGSGFFDNVDVSGGVLGKTLGTQAKPFDTGYFGTMNSDEIACGGLAVARINNLIPSGGVYMQTGMIRIVTPLNSPMALFGGNAVGSQNFSVYPGEHFRLTMSGTGLMDEKNGNGLQIKFFLGETEFMDTGDMSLMRTTTNAAESWSYKLDFGMYARRNNEGGDDDYIYEVRSSGIFSYLFTGRRFATNSVVRGIPIGVNVTISATAAWTGVTPNNVLNLHNLFVQKIF